MMNLFGLMNLGQNALSVQQRGLEVTSNNIANVNTPGYSRQKLHMVSSEPMALGSYSEATLAGQYGTGVSADSVNRIRDMYLDNRFREAGQDAAMWQAQRDGLGQVEGIFMELGEDAVNGQLDAFWGSWQNLEQDPQSLAYRQEVLSRGQAVAGSLNRIGNELDDFRMVVQDMIAAEIPGINAMADRIAALNVNIRESLAMGNQPNAELDERDLLLDELSGLADVQISHKANGTVIVSLNEHNLVQEGESMHMVVPPKGADGFADIYWGHDGSSVRFEGGKLGGMVTVRDKIIPDYINQVERFGDSIMDSVNTLHNGGLELSGAVAGDFFQRSASGDLETVFNNPLMVAAAIAGEGRAGNSNALAISQLRDQMHTEYSKIVTNYAQEADEAGTMATMRSATQANLDTERQSVSGVSLDEEMTNMVKYQHAYNAAARLITTVDEMLDTVINRMGRVGR